MSGDAVERRRRRGQAHKRRSITPRAAARKRAGYNFIPVGAESQWKPGGEYVACSTAGRLVCYGS